MFYYNALRAKSTKMPYVSYVDLARWLDVLLQRLYTAIDAYFTAVPSGKRSSRGFYEFCVAGSSSGFTDVFVCDGYRLCRAAKLLMSLGYGNFSTVIQYDIYAMAKDINNLAARQRRYPSQTKTRE